MEVRIKTTEGTLIFTDEGRERWLGITFLFDEGEHEEILGDVQNQDIKRLAKYLD